MIGEHGVLDYRLAKEKAASQLGIRERRYLPRNHEIEAALAEHQRLFDAQHQTRLSRLREVAIQAMQLFEAFRPRLVGAVLSGRATRHSDVQLHLFADYLEAVDVFLHEQGLPFETGEKRFRQAGDKYVFKPVYRFMAGDTGVEAAVFAADEIRQPPLCPINGAPMARASLTQVQALPV